MNKFNVLYYGNKFAEISAPTYKDAVIQMGMRFGGMIGLTLVEA